MRHALSAKKVTQFLTESHNKTHSHRSHTWSHPVLSYTVLHSHSHTATQPHSHTATTVTQARHSRAGSSTTPLRSHSQQGRFHCRTIAVLDSRPRLDDWRVPHHDACGTRQEEPSEPYSTHSCRAVQISRPAGRRTAPGTLRSAPASIAAWPITL